MVTEKQKANLRPFTSENARERQRKGVEARRANQQRTKPIDDNLDAAIAMLFGHSKMGELDKAAMKADSEYLRRLPDIIKDKQGFMEVVNHIIDRTIGRPKQAIDANIAGEVDMHFKFGDE